MRHDLAQVLQPGEARDRDAPTRAERRRRLRQIQQPAPLDLSEKRPRRRPSPSSWGSAVSASTRCAFITSTAWRQLHEPAAGHGQPLRITALQLCRVVGRTPRQAKQAGIPNAGRTAAASTHRRRPSSKSHTPAWRRNMLPYPPSPSRSPAVDAETKRVVRKARSMARTWFRSTSHP